MCEKVGVVEGFVLPAVKINPRLPDAARVKGNQVGRVAETRPDVAELLLAEEKIFYS